MNNDPLGFGGNFIQGKLPTYQAPTKKQGKKKKGFWEDQISTLGSIGGAGGGAALGAAAGSVVPGVGTIIGGLLGAVLGGAGGGGLGQRVENSVVGDDLNKDVLKESLLGGATGIGPIRGASMLAKGGKAAFTGGGIKEALEQGATATPIRNALGKMSGTTADGLVTKGLRLSPSQTTNFKEKFGEDVVTTVRNNGLIGKNADDIGLARQGLNQQFDNIVTSAPDVPKAEVLKRINQEAQRLSKAGPSDSKQTAENLLAEAQASLAGFGDTIPASALNGLRRNFDSLVNYTEKASNPSRYNVNKRMADALRGSLQSTADNAGLKTSTGSSFKELGTEISKLSQLNKVATKQEGLGRGAGPLGLRDAISMGGAGVPGLAIGGPIGGVLGAGFGIGASKLVNSPTAIRGATKALDGLSGRYASKTVNPLALTGQTGRAGGVETIEQALMPRTPELDETQMQDDTQLADINGYYGLDESGQPTGEQVAGTNPFGVSREEVAQGMLSAMQAGDKTAYSQLKDLYDMISEYEAESAGSGYNSSTADKIAMSDNGLNTLAQLEALYSQAGGAQGKIGGGIQTYLSKKTDLNSNAGAYIDLAGSAETQIAKAIAGGGQVSDADAEAIRKAIPQITDTPQQAALKFRDLKERLAKARQNTIFYNSGSAEE